VPVVQPDHGAYPEWVNATRGGLLHRPHDTANLAEKLAILLRDASLRERMGQQAQQAAWEKFSSERMASSTLRVFQKLCRSEHKSPLDALPPLA
jgi:glycosyltransferase involved in cell wall biosynthesis